MNGEYIWFIISQEVKRNSAEDLEHTVNKQETELETLKCKFDDLIRKFSYIKSTSDKSNNSAEESKEFVKKVKSSSSFSAVVDVRCTISKSLSRASMEDS